MSVKISELPVLAPEDVAAGDVVAIVDASEGVTKQVDLSGVLAGGGSGDPFAAKAIAEPFLIWDHITGAPIPDNSGTAKFIRLIAGQSGAGGYNEGLLTDEQVSGSAPDIVATAEIMVGPMAGQRIPLIGTEGSFLRPGTDSGELLLGTAIYNAGGVTAIAVPRDGDSVKRADGTVEISITRNSANAFDNITGSRSFGVSRPKNRKATPYARIA